MIMIAYLIKWNYCFLSHQNLNLLSNSKKFKFKLGNHNNQQNLIAICNYQMLKNSSVFRNEDYY